MFNVVYTQSHVKCKMLREFGVNTYWWNAFRSNTFSHEGEHLKALGGNSCFLQSIDIPLSQCHAWGECLPSLLCCCAGTVDPSSMQMAQKNVSRIRGMRRPPARLSSLIWVMAIAFCLVSFPLPASNGLKIKKKFFC